METGEEEEEEGGDRIGIFAWYRLASLVPARWIRIPPTEFRLEKYY